MTEAENPLLADEFRIAFDRIGAEHVVPGVERVLSDARAELDALVGETAPPTYENTIQALDDLTERVKRRIAPVGHLLSVAESPELREAYNRVLPEISRFWTALQLDQGLWKRLKAFAATAEAAALDEVRARHVERTLAEFRRAGADLPEDVREHLRELKVEVTQKQQKFSENVLDATNAFSLLVTDRARLEGLPDADLEQARRKAEERGQEGWLLTLDYPSFEPVVKHVHDRDLREQMYAAYTTRCREGEFANVDLVVDLLRLRREIAETLGYAHFPDYRLEDHMAKTGAQALAFVEDMTAKTRPYWERDYRELAEHARAMGLDELMPWDVAYVAEDLRRTRFDFDDEAIRPYFPLDRVLEGLFEIVRRVFGLTVREDRIPEVWDPQVRYYHLYDEDGTHLGSFYADWFPRPNKRQGAWMNDLVTGGPAPEGAFRPHLGVVAGNLTPPKGDRPPLLTHREVETIFHEFGHLLHHLTSRVPIAPRAGINVAWDFVELPSQIMENWTWEREALPLFSGHYETGEPLPNDLFERLLEARRFMGGWYQMRQLAFGYTDLRLHLHYDPDRDGDVMRYVETLLEGYTPAPVFRRYHSTTSFTHLFAGGYAAAYYSYLWSEVLEADAFGRFVREGVFNRQVGRAFLDAILTRGDSADPELLFREFMGRDPDPQALLDRNLGSL